MKKILDTILSPRLFAVCYLPWLAVNMATVINVLDFTRLVLIAYALWAVAICVKVYLFSGKGPWLNKGMPLLLLFMAACLVSQALQFNAGGFDVVGKMCYFSLCLLLLYTQHGNTVSDYKQALGVVGRVLGVVIGAMMAVSDWMFFHLYSGRIEVRSGSTPYVGFAENRLYGIFTSPNVGATYALILIWCAVMVLAWSGKMKHKSLWRTLAIIEILLAAIFVSVALSKGFYVTGAVLVVAAVVVNLPRLKERAAVRHGWLNTTGGKVASVPLSLLCILLSLAVCWGALEGMNKLSVNTMKWLNTPAVSSGSVGSSDLYEDERQEMINNALLGFDGRVEAGRDDIDLTNKRSSIWTSHLSLLRGKHLFIGINRPTAYLAANPSAETLLTPKEVSEIHRAGGNMHCGYLQILIHHGVLALLPMLAFLLWCGIKAVRCLVARFGGKRQPDGEAYDLFAWTLPLVLAILVNNVFETNFVLMGANFFQAVFWFYAGACVLSMQKGAKEQ